MSHKAFGMIQLERIPSDFIARTSDACRGRANRGGTIALTFPLLHSRQS